MADASRQASGAAAASKGVSPAPQGRGIKRPAAQREAEPAEPTDSGKNSPKRKGPQRPTRQPGEKGGKGLRHFSLKVCEKVESKGRTSYNEVADELVAEMQNPDEFGPDERFDEKNIRRRVYDALNVLMAMNIIAKEKKEILWKGLPALETDEEHQRGEKIRIATRIDRKKAYLQDLSEQLTGLQSLVERNVARPRGLSTRCIQLPFLLVKTKPQATVELEIAEDEQLVHFDFNSTPFEIQDENNVLRQMGLHAICGTDQLPPPEAVADAAEPPPPPPSGTRYDE